MPHEQLGMCKEKWKRADRHFNESDKAGGWRDRLLALENDFKNLQIRLDLVEKGVMKGAVIGGIIGALIGSGCGTLLPKLITMILKLG